MLAQQILCNSTAENTLASCCYSLSRPVPQCYLSGIYVLFNLSSSLNWANIKKGTFSLLSAKI